MPYPPVELDPAGKARTRKQDAWDLSLLLEVAVKGQVLAAGQVYQDLCPVPGDGLDLLAEEVRMGPRNTLPRSSA
jgi:hypothetical protein